MGNMEKSTETGNSKTQSAIVAALVVGLLVGFFIGRSWGEKYEGPLDKEVPVEEAENVAEKTELPAGTEPSKTESVKKEAQAEASASDVTGTVAVADQAAGKTALVSKVTLSNAGWVVVREDTGNGMGSILGAQWLPAGTADAVVVDLLRGTEANKNYFVALYNDNGDKKFDKVSDLPIAVGGKVVSAVFSTK